MADTYQTVVIGGGQAGLSISYYLTQSHHEHIILEKASRPASAWRDDRWDSFTLVTPNWTFRLPGNEYTGDDPNGFMPRKEIVETFEAYIERYRLPVNYGVTATSVEQSNGGFLVKTENGSFKSANVVVATGLFQHPKFPDFAARLPPEILQLHSGSYRNPGSLPSGAVLVVGSGQSGCQIAEELYQSGRSVFLCVGKTGRVPRRYRGRDLVEWLVLIGFMNRTVDQLPSRRDRFSGNPHVSGKNGGHDLNLHRFARDGVHLLGRLVDTRDGRIYLSPDLHEKLVQVDAFEANIIQKIDAFINNNHLDVPEEKLALLSDGFDTPILNELDLKRAGIQTIIWALGYNFDFSMVRLPIFDETGFPISQNGETSVSGLYFLGMPWLPFSKTGIFLGIGEAASMLAGRLSA